MKRTNSETENLSSGSVGGPGFHGTKLGLDLICQVCFPLLRALLFLY